MTTSTIVPPAYIDRFTGSYRFLSNFAPCLVSLDGQTYYTVEGAYQAAKSPNAEHRSMCRITTPGNAKRLGRRVTLRTDWEQVKLDVMRGLLRQKFGTEHAGLAGYPKYRAGLLLTGRAVLIEGNDWGDREWGCVQVLNAVGQPDYVTDRGVKWWGRNLLGRLLMEVRHEAQEDHDNVQTRNL